MLQITLCVLTYVYALLFSEEDDHSKLVHYSIIILAICTLGTSILLWWLYKELDKYCGGKDKYDVEGTIVYALCTCIRTYAYLRRFINL